MSVTSAFKVRREALRAREDGFTLIELLIVVIIIGILAAIAIPIYIGVQNNAKDSAVKSDLQNIKTAVVAYFTGTNSATAPTLDAATLSSYGFSLTGGVYASSGAPSYKAGGGQTPTSFCIQATSATTKIFNVTSSAGVGTGACT